MLGLVWSGPAPDARGGTELRFRVGGGPGVAKAPSPTDRISGDRSFPAYASAAAECQSWQQRVQQVDAALSLSFRHR